MSRVRIWLTSALVVGLSLVALPQVSAQELKAGTVRIPRDLKVGDVTTGSYSVRIEPGDEGPYFVIAKRDGTELLRELAIVQDRGSKVGRVESSVQVLTKQEHMVRLIVRHGSKRYLAYFETTS